MIDIKRLSLEEYLDATELGGGFLFDFDNYRFIEATDNEDKPRYLVVKKYNNKSFDDIDPTLDEVEFAQLRLIDFHNLCSLYILSLQEGCKVEALNALNSDLLKLFR